MHLFFFLFVAVSRWSGICALPCTCLQTSCSTRDRCHTAPFAGHMRPQSRQFTAVLTLPQRPSSPRSSAYSQWRGGRVGVLSARLYLPTLQRPIWPHGALSQASTLPSERRARPTRQSNGPSSNSVGDQSDLMSSPRFSTASISYPKTD